ncbi:unnamed protein product, partial [Choristocarpus tenellus]
LRAIAGIWRAGGGVVYRPAPLDTFFLPQVCLSQIRYDESLVERLEICPNTKDTLKTHLLLREPFHLRGVLTSFQQIIIISCVDCVLTSTVLQYYCWLCVHYNQKRKMLIRAPLPTSCTLNLLYCVNPPHPLLISPCPPWTSTSTC